MMTGLIFLGSGRAVLFFRFNTQDMACLLDPSIILSLVDSVLKHHCFVDEALLSHQPIVYVCVAS